MQEDPRRTIARLHEHILRPGTIDHLQSRQFTAFCREHDLGEAWQEALEYCGEKPGVSGTAVISMAFHLLLRHLYDQKRDEFPTVLAGTLAIFFRAYPGPEFVSGIFDDLVLLGYSQKEMKALLEKTWK
jgi:hypothetical protein